MKCLALIAVLLIQGVLFAQAPSGSISGQIRDKDGVTISGVRVAVASLNETGQVASDTLVAISKTDNAGNYRLEGIPAGRYAIIAGAVISPTYYPGTASRSQATIVTIAPESLTTDLDFRLVTMTFLQSGGSVQSAGAVKPVVTMMAKDNTTGAFVPVMLFGRAAPPLQQLSGRVLAEGMKLPPDLANLRVVFTANAKFQGYTTVESDGRTTIAANDSVWTSVGPDGSIRLALAEPNEYAIQLARPDSKPLDGYIVKSITVGSVDVLKDKLKVKGPIPGEIVITLIPIRVGEPN